MARLRMTRNRSVHKNVHEDSESFFNAAMAKKSRHPNQKRMPALSE